MKPGMRAIIYRLVAGALPFLLAFEIASAASVESETKANGLFFSDWRIEGLKSHPLVGKVWATDRGAFVSPQAAMMKLRGSSIVLLGEIHDNNDHHRLQAFVLKSLIEGGRRPGAVFEQLRSDVQPALDSTRKDGALSVEAFKRIVDWNSSGWKDFDYDPIFETILAGGLDIFAGDVPRAQMMRVAREGLEAIGAAERGRLGLDRPLGSRQEQAARDEIFEAHCGVMPRSDLARMASAQRFRDAHLADAGLRAAQKHGSAVLFAGSGHVRSDRGVPWYLLARAPQTTVVSVMLVEVEDGGDDPSAYVPRDPDGKPAADLLIFTPRAERGDPCAKLRAMDKR